MIKLFVNIDSEGNIINSVAGETVVPNVEYGFYFEVDSWEIPQNIGNYKVVNNELVLKNEFYIN
ncbi:hypothetical protein NKR74_14795 [Bacillus sp. 3103sda1]|uniref:hypothetical protein n=1 Tax=Bacillus sp. 3103sda1 TaxID=2953808 RepID=UPI00209F8527|nr:hypothetical protein [Bacillus sp. 3103sda1]MCP1124556.1 hypothetical protein [Bacillus sp. 3103sda1]